MFVHFVIPVQGKNIKKILRWPPLGAIGSQSFKKYFAPNGGHLGFFLYFFSERGRQNYLICKDLEFFLQN